MHIIPTSFCNRNCSYCINSSKNFNYIDLRDFQKDIKYIFNELKSVNNFNNIWFEWNGGEFTLVPEIEKYFEIFIQEWIKIRSQIDYKKFNIILTTNFQQKREIYQKIENIISSEIDRYRYFVSLHYDYPLSFIDQIFDYLKYLKDNGEFEINIMKSKDNDKSNQNKKFFKKIKKNVSIFDPKILKKHLRLRYSYLIPKEFINQGQPFLKMNKKYCSGSIYFYQYPGIINNYCEDKRYTPENFKITNNFKSCNKTCAGQAFDARLFKPKYKNIKYQFYKTKKKF